MGIFPLAKTDTCQLLSLGHDIVVDDVGGVGDGDGNAEGQQLGGGANAFVPRLAAFRTTGEDNDNDEDDSDAVVFELKGKDKTCGWVREKLDKLVAAAGTAEDGKNKKKAKKKTKKLCKTKVNGKTERIANVCEEVCKEAKKALSA